MVEKYLPDSLKKTALEAVAYVGKNQTLFDAFYVMACKDNGSEGLRAANVVQKCTENYPDMIEKHVPDMLAKMPNFKTDGVKRCFLKFFTLYQYTGNEEWLTTLIDVCIRFLGIEHSESIAVQAYSLSTLQKLCKLYPEIIAEITFLVEQLQPYAGKALQSRMKQVVKQIKKI